MAAYEKVRESKLHVSTAAQKVEEFLLISQLSLCGEGTRQHPIEFDTNTDVLLNVGQFNVLTCPLRAEYPLYRSSAVKRNLH